jgi:hypothetical protein
MTNFLPAGIINETISEVCQKATQLREETDPERLRKGLVEIEEIALELALFLEKMSCQPLIFTGPGTTEEVIKRLDWALAFSEEIDPMEIVRCQKEATRHKSTR